jgi:hypothetical protein
MEHLSSFIADCDRKTELAKRRLKETQEELSEEANGKVTIEFDSIFNCVHIPKFVECITVATILHCDETLNDTNKV